ncbi:MAG: molybdate ABC transporter substrate-binding protein [Pseudomonadota bacterium]|nr:molybdate ABC transporter substrate-binding protein [Pseudomonadota bacterium]
MSRSLAGTLFAAIVGGLLLAPPIKAANAGETHVAVAANFTDAAKEIAESFANATGHQAVLSFGSTGQLYNQIAQGAPFDVFLAADAERPARAIAEGYGVPGSAFTYAIGRIVLWSPDAAMVKGAETLRGGDFDKLAIANPETAPYGKAAIETLQALGVYEALRGKLVQGNNIAQTFQFVETRNAELGFVALSQLMGMQNGSRWLVPQDLYQPIRQDAVLLSSAEGNEAAKAFVDFLQGPEARAIIERYGYGTETKTN